MTVFSFLVSAKTGRHWIWTGGYMFMLVCGLRHARFCIAWAKCVRLGDCTAELSSRFELGGLPAFCARVSKVPFFTPPPSPPFPLAPSSLFRALFGRTWSTPPFSLKFFLLLTDPQQQVCTFAGVH
jgi:hypothetical protein